MTAEVDICNIGLGWIGGNLITDFENDSIEAILCKANYELLRDAVQEEIEWSFCIKRAILTPIQAEPVYGGGKLMLQPSDSLRILEVNQNEIEWTKEGDYILCNEDSIEVRYIARITDPTRFSPTFIQALANRIASDLAIPIARSRTLAEHHWTIYETKFFLAKNTDGKQGKSQRKRSKRLLRNR